MEGVCIYVCSAPGHRPRIYATLNKYESQLTVIPEQFISCRLLVDVNRYECGLEHQSNANDVSEQCYSVR